MDGDNLDPLLLAGDLRNLETLNRFFGGRAVVGRRLKEVLETPGPGETLSVLDVGSGGGDLCRHVVDLCRTRDRAVRLWSLDRHPQIQAFARSESAGYPEIRFVRGDATRLPFRDGSVDVALCTLALHHFTEADAERVLSEMRRIARKAAIVSDLYRSRPALAAVWLATRFTSNPMTRFDGPASVRRAFTHEELLQLAGKAGWQKPRLVADPWFRVSLISEGCGPW